MDREKRIEEAYHKFYHEDGVPCAVGTLMLFSEFYDLPLDQQVLDSATGMVGAGKTGKQCGLMEAGIMFIGIMGKAKGVAKADIFKLCGAWSKTFEAEMGSTECKGLRPFPFTPEDAPKHLCEPISVKAMKMAVGFMDDNLMPAVAAAAK